MKIATLKNFKTKLLKLKLLKTKVYKSKNHLHYLHLNDIEVRLKKICYIIYKFHIANKKILFLGTPFYLKNNIKRFLINKQHSFIPEFLWFSGIITNPQISFSYLEQQYIFTQNKLLKTLFFLKKQIDLIVVLQEEFNIKAFKESSLKRIPVITLNSINNLSTLELSTYKSQGDYSFLRKPIRNNFFFVLLNSLLKKAETLKTNQIKQNLKQIKFKWKKKKFKNQIKYKKKNVFSKKK